MSSRITWYNRTKTVILWELFDHSGWEDIHRGQDEIFTMLDTVNHTVDIISVSYDSALPPNTLPNLKRLIDRTHRNERYKVIVNASSFTRSMFDIVGKLNRIQAADWHFADTIEDAELLLAKLHNQRSGDSA